MKKYVLAIDQGTTSSRAMIFELDNLHMVQSASEEYPQIYPKAGWVEHNLNDIWDTVNRSIERCFKKSNLNPKHIAAIGITNQRETTCAFDASGTPLHNALVWQDRRTSDYCLKRRDEYGSLKKITGLPLDSYFSASKIRWLLDHSDAVQAALNDNELRVGTIDSYLIYRLSGGRSFVSDLSNASRTLLLNLKTGQWDDELLRFFDIPVEILAKPCASFGDLGRTSGHCFLPDGIPISCALGDQQSALFGQSCIEAGELKCTYGTGAFALLNTGEHLQDSPNGLLSTIAYQDQSGHIRYALEGSSYIAGAAVQWLRDELKIIKQSSEVEDLAIKIKDKQQVSDTLFMPFFSGMASPYWDDQVKGAIVGLNRGVSREHLAYCCLEGIALSIYDLIQTMQKDLKQPLSALSVDGGATVNNTLMQMQANFLDMPIQRPGFIETTVFGAAFGAKVGLGEARIEQARDYQKIEREFKPDKDLKYEKRKIQLWDLWCQTLLDQSKKARNL